MYTTKTQEVWYQLYSSHHPPPLYPYLRNPLPPNQVISVHFCSFLVVSVQNEPRFSLFLVGRSGNEVISFHLSKKQELTKVISTISACNQNPNIFRFFLTTMDEWTSLTWKGGARSIWRRNMAASKFVKLSSTKMHLSTAKAKRVGPGGVPLQREHL